MADESGLGLIWSAGLTAAGTVIVGLIGYFAQRREAPPIPVTPDAEMRELADRITDNVDKVQDAVSEVKGQVGVLARALDKVDGFRERLAVVESAVGKIEGAVLTLQDSNRELHAIKHKMNNMDMKVDGLARLVSMPVEDRQEALKGDPHG